LKKQIAVALLAVQSFSAMAGILIDDGIAARANQYSSVVKIEYFEVANKKETSVGHCTGTLIAQDIVLTAAHCVNTDKNNIQRVSLSGDNKGDAKDRLVTGGIKVKQSFKSISYDYAKYQAAVIAQQMQTEEFERLSVDEKQTIQINAYIASQIVNSYDIAFLQLERPQVMLASALSSLGCKASLKAGDAVAIAGYGLKSVKDSKENFNKDYVLNYGYNKIAASPLLELVYTIEKAAGMQLVNSGDSGGPIFKKTNQKIVYGVTSTKALNEKEENIVSTFGSLSSASAKEIYKSLSTNANVPKNLQDIAKNCL